MNVSRPAPSTTYWRTPRVTAAASSSSATRLRSTSVQPRLTQPIALPLLRGRKVHLEHARLDVPAAAVFVPCEFTSQSIAAALERAGLDRARPTFFSWLGVTMYLDPATTLRIVTELASLATGGGGLVFDYTVHPGTVGLVKRLAFKVLAGRVARAGEPFIGFFHPPELVASIRRAGFGEVEDLSAADLTARFLAHRHDGLRLSGLGHLLCARA